MLSDRLQTILHKKNSSSLLSKYSLENIAQLKNLSNVAWEAPDNFV